VAVAGLFLPRLSRELVNRKKRVLQSVVAIVKIATGRETLLIGPSAAFGANARRHLIRDRNRLRHKLDVFMTRPGAADLVRPYLRRWGLHWAHSRLSERETIKDALLRAAASGQLAIAVVPETTLALAAMRPADSDFARAARLAQQPAGDALPNAIVDRVAIVLVPASLLLSTRSPRRCGASPTLDRVPISSRRQRLSRRRSLLLSWQASSTN
jgi:hypothetical protein